LFFYQKKILNIKKKKKKKKPGAEPSGCSSFAFCSSFLVPYFSDPPFASLGLAFFASRCLKYNQKKSVLFFFFSPFSEAQPCSEWRKEETHKEAFL
jgi:hypothetical protein